MDLAEDVDDEHRIRYANREAATVLEGHFEVTSLVGTLSVGTIMVGVVGMAMMARCVPR